MRLYMIFALGFLSLFAKEITAEYRVTYGIFGTVAKAYAKLEMNESNYKIVVDVESVGIAKMLSHHRSEHYESMGNVKNGMLHPKVFLRQKQSTKRIDIKRYIFDYANKRIIVHTDKNKFGQFHVQSTHPLNYFAKDDVLTLYFNLQNYLTPHTKHYVFHAVGGSEKDGEVDVDILPKSKKYRKLLKKDGLYLKVTLHQKIFASKKGELFLVMDNDGIATRGVLKDVIFFGDIVGELVKKEIRE